MRVGSWHSPIKQWVSANASALKARPVALFTACPMKAPEGDFRDLDAVSAWAHDIAPDLGIIPATSS